MPREEETVTEQPPWVITFSDMMTLLLTFFVLLVSMSELKKDDKFQGIADSLETQFGSERGRKPSSGEVEIHHAALASIVGSTRDLRRQLVGATNTDIDAARLTFAEDEIELTVAHREQLMTLPLTRGSSVKFTIFAVNEPNSDRLFARLRKLRLALSEIWKADERDIAVVIDSADDSAADNPNAIRVRVAELTTKRSPAVALSGMRSTTDR